MKRWPLAIALILPMTVHAQAPTEPRPRVTARDLYIGCTLFARNAEASSLDDPGEKLPFSAIRCVETAFNALGYSRMIRPGTDWEYCLPDSASVAADRARSMALAYLDFYEAVGRVKPNDDGLTMFLYAMKETWPCDPS